MAAWAPPPAPPHPLAALHTHRRPLTRSNPLFKEEEEQEIIVVVDSLEEGNAADEPAPPRPPRRAPSTSSGYGSGGSGGGSHGRVTPDIPKKYPDAHNLDQKAFRENVEENALVLRLSDADKALVLRDSEGSHKSDSSGDSQRLSDDDCERPLSKSLQEDIQACLGGFNKAKAKYDRDVEDVLAVAGRGACGVAVARARLQAALLALQADLPAVKEMPLSKAAAVPYCGPGVRPGDVTMMPKSTDMSLLAASALFTLDAAKGEILAKRLAKRTRRRRRCRVVLVVLALLVLMAAIAAVELLMSRGARMFGASLY